MIDDFFSPHQSLEQFLELSWIKSQQELGGSEAKTMTNTASAGTDLLKTLQFLWPQVVDRTLALRPAKF